MTNGRETKRKQQHYTLTWLPWALGLATLVGFLATLNHSISFLPDWSGFIPPPLQQPPVGVRGAGWVFGAEFLAPVYYAVTYPLRWLPEQYVPLSLNIFSAICASLALGQLARCVALLPHDRTRDQRERENHSQALLTLPLAWLPPVLATVVCGLGLSFWEHATNGTGEMFDLLLFVYVVRNLLEYRLDEKQGRLFRAALVFGAGMTNNVAMIAFFPLFIVALVWTRKLEFFNLKFLGRMSLCGLAGLSFYLLLPLVGSLTENQPLSFWQLLAANLHAQKWLLTIFPKITLLLLSLTTILPVFLFSIKWSSQFGDPSRLGVIITTISFHLCHLVVLLACLWMVLDPGFSPRNRGFGLAFLPLYFLAALNIGYYSGYLLLVSRALPGNFRKVAPAALFLQRCTTIALLALLVGVPAALIHRNLPQVRLTNGPLQQEFAGDLGEHLPPDGIIISDDPRRLWILQEWLARQGRTRDYIALCSQWLASPQYQDYLKARYAEWTPPVGPATDAQVSDSDLLKLIEKLGKEKTITYLHPSFGYYFESFAGEPNGLTQRLVPYAPTDLLPPPPSPDVIASNQKFWAEAESGVLKTIQEVTIPPKPGQQLTPLEKFYRTIGLKPEKNMQAVILGAYYSRSLVHWAVELQRFGNYESAAAHLELARQLNPKNAVAEINLAFNQKYRSGQAINVEFTRALDDYFGESRSWEQVLSLNGPFDDPTLTFAQGYAFIRGNLPRQAAHAFNRTRVQSTNDVASRLWLGQINLNLNFPDRTLDMIREIRQIAERVPAVRTNLTDLFTLEAAAYLAKKDDATAQRIINTNLAKHPDDFNLLASACKAYADNGRSTNALELTERMLQLEPDNVSCLINKGSFLVELGNYNQAIAAFDRVLTLETNNYTAILYRAIASLRGDKFDDAVNDYEVVQRQFPKAFQVDYGLGEIAYRRKDTNAAIRHYEAYLDNAPANTVEARFIEERLHELKGTKPAKTE